MVDTRARLHPGVPKAMPIPKTVPVRCESRDGRMRVTCVMPLAELQAYMRDIGTVFQGGVFEVPVFFVVHHKNGIRMRFERDAHAGVPLAQAIQGMAAAIHEETPDKVREAHVTAFEFELACGCGVRVDVDAPWAHPGCVS